MSTYNNCIRFIHHKPPPFMKITIKKYYCRDGQKKDISTYNAKTPIHKENNGEVSPQGTPAARYPATASITAEVYNDSSRETETAVNAAENVDSPDPAAGRRPIEGGIENARSVVERGAGNTSLGRFDDNRHTGNDSLSNGMPLLSEEIPQAARSGGDIHTVSPPEKQPENMITDAYSRLTDAAARFIEAADAKSRGGGEHCGLLHFREWWELVEVNILVGGKLISGIPILIEEDTLRVINNKHSYFIPLGKIDYIRTADGLRSDFY